MDFPIVVKVQIEITTANNKVNQKAPEKEEKRPSRKIKQCMIKSDGLT